MYQPSFHVVLVPLVISVTLTSAPVVFFTSVFEFSSQSKYSTFVAALASVPGSTNPVHTIASARRAHSDFFITFFIKKPP